MKKVLILAGILGLTSWGVIASDLLATDHNHVNGSTVSHSGGTNSAGCHNDYKRGGYHCH